MSNFPEATIFITKEFDRPIDLCSDSLLLKVFNEFSLNPRTDHWVTSTVAQRKVVTRRIEVATHGLKYMTQSR
ncbi:MAG: hypothetical protein OEY99_07825, partial [Aigarchaeota archaeon]|nr:hypothetical protein [Aigarchaeota archaeon]